MKTQQSIKLYSAESSHGGCIVFSSQSRLHPTGDSELECQLRMSTRPLHVGWANIASTPQQPWKTEPTSAEEQPPVLPQHRCSIFFLGKTYGYITLQQWLPGRVCHVPVRREHGAENGHNGPAGPSVWRERESVRWLWKWMRR